MSTASNTASKRQPVSCQPCIKRKIKCGRGTPPCNTCVRRGVPQRCSYRPRAGDARLQHLVRNTTRPLPINQNDLLERLDTLENLVHRHLRDSCETPEDRHISSPSTITASDRSASRTEFGEKGRIWTSKSGHVRYEQPGSNCWESALPESPVYRMMDQDSERSNSQDLAIGFPFDAGTNLALEELLKDLPPLSYCDLLKDRFFKVFSPLFHILHDITFENVYREFRDNPHAMAHSWLALLFVILGIAVTALSDDEPLLQDLGQKRSSHENVQVLTARYRRTAMRLLAADQVMIQYNMQSLQALILLIYSINHSQGNTWPLLGMTYNIALSMGCHVDPIHFGLSEVESEERRRAWAGLMMLYTIQNTSMRNLDPMKTQYQVRLPADVDDIDLLPGNSRIIKNGPTQMSYILFKFRLYSISSEVCHLALATTNPDANSVNVLHLKINAEQELWNRKYLSDTRTQALETHHVVNLNILYSYSHQLLLLLHKSSFLPSLAQNSNPECRDSQSICIESAKSILAIHKRLADSVEFQPYRWYTNGLGSFYAFHAAVVIATALISPVVEHKDEDLLSLMSEALTRFERLSDRSIICQRAAVILGSLWNLAQRAQMASATASIMPPSALGHSNTENQAVLDQEASQIGDTWSTDSQMDALFTQLRPELWLGPGSMSWNEWTVLLESLNST